MSAKLLQLTNPSIGAVAANALVPLGTTTLVYPICNSGCCQTYTVTSSMADTVQINKSGVYRILYNASFVATAAGDVVLVLKLNGVTKYTVTVTATAAGVVNVTIPFTVYLPCNCAGNPSNIPAYVQIQSTGVDITSGTSNLVISRE